MRGKYRVEAAGTQESEQPKSTLSQRNTASPLFTPLTLHNRNLCMANSKMLRKLAIRHAQASERPA
jgi:hypothetical protein